MANQSFYVFGNQLDGAGGATAIGPDFPAGNATVWQHIDYGERGEAQAWLREQGLNPLVIDSLTRTETRPRAVGTDDGLMLVLRGINRNAGADGEDMVSLRLWIQPNRLISVRQRSVLSAQEINTELQANTGPRDISQLVILLIEKLADCVAEFVDDLEEQMEAHEAEVETGDIAAVRTRVSELRRKVAAVRRYMAPQREALEAVHHQGANTLTTEQRYLIREQSDRITRYIEDLDLLRERTLVIQEELLNRVSQEQNARTYVLSIVATIFLPITFVSGVFGMNTAGLPGLEEESAFWLVAVFMLSVSIAVIIWLRMKRWL